jgi:hypothetical protein
MELKSQNRKEIAGKILEVLLNDHLEATKSLCEELGYKIEDLQPASIDMFSNKGVTSDLKDIRFTHFEERRIAKIIKIASDILKNNLNVASNNIASLLQDINFIKNSRNNSIQSSRSNKSISLSVFTKPQDFISYGLEKEKEKFRKSIRTLENISMIRDREKIKAEEKMIRFENKNNLILKNRIQKDDDFQKSVTSRVERRKNILLKKYEIKHNIDKSMAEYGHNLEKRMARLSESQKIEIREKLKKKEIKLREKLENERKKLELNQKTIADENAFVENMITSIQNKIDKKVLEFTNVLENRVKSARNHSLKVSNILRISLKTESANEAENLRKNINKSLMSSRKIEKKILIASESSEKIKKMLDQSFQNHKRGISEKNAEELKRLEKIQSRFNSKERTAMGIQKLIHEKFEEKRQKNFIRMENHFKTYIEKKRDEVIIK